MGVGPAVDLRARLQSHLRDIYFQSDPPAALGQIAHATTAYRTRLAPLDFVVPPVSTVLPVVRMKLQHDLLGWIECVDIDVGKKFHSLLNYQGGVSSAEDELLQLVCLQHECLGSA